MGQNTPSIKLPFANVADLTPKARYQIRRNFEELQRGITGGVSLFDAVIDPAQASNAGVHVYKNITDFTVGEAALLASTHMTMVAVVGRPGTVVTETSNITLNGPVTFVAAGMDAAIAPFGTDNRPKIDFAGFSITNTKWVNFVGLELTNSGSTLATLVSGLASFDNCTINGTNSGGTQKINNVCGGTYAVYKDTSIWQTNGLGSNVWAQNCIWTWPIAGGTIGASGGLFYWDGGSFEPGGTTPILGFSGSARVYCRASFNTGFTGSSAGTRTLVSLSSTAPCFVDIETLVNPPDLTVAAGAGDVIVRGFFETVTISGNTNLHMRKIDVLHSNGTMDVTGPCEINAMVASSAANPKIILRGSGISANLTMANQSTNPFLALIACTDSMIVASFKPPGAAGVQAYTIDAASARCVLVTAGTTHANFSVASTNAGTNCRVITETTDTIVSAGSPYDDAIANMGLYD